MEKQDSDDVGRQSLTLSSFVERSRLLARAFRHSLGLREGDHASIYLPNTTEFHCNVLGMWLCRAVVSPGDPSTTTSGLGHQVNEVRCKVVVCSLDTLDKVLEALELHGLRETAKVVVVSLHRDVAAARRDSHIYSYTGLLEQARSLPPLPSGLVDKPCEPEDVALVIWSSGTTGRPKGIQLIYKCLQNYLRPDALPTGEFIQTTCFFHGGGLLMPVAWLVGKGSSRFFPVASLEDESCAELLFQAIEAFKPDSFVGGSHHIVRMCNAAVEASEKYDLGSLLYAAPLGATIPQNSDGLLKRHFPNFRFILNIYGQSEFGNMISMSFTPKHLGHIARGTEVKIVDLESGRVCGPNRVGEIMARCHVTMKGYLNRPEETAKFFGEDGFIHTGDLGHYDEEGILHYDSRLKEMIKFQNVHIHPLEVEEVINRHPEVLEVGVFGKPHHTDQEHVAAAVVIKKGSRVTEEDIQKLVQQTLEKPKWLRGGVHFLDSLPHNPQGKVQRKHLEQMHMSSQVERKKRSRVHFEKIMLNRSW